MTFGALGPHALKFVDDAADRYSVKCAVDRDVCRTQLVQRVQVALSTRLASLLSGIQAGEEEDGAERTAGSGWGQPNM